MRKNKTCPAPGILSNAGRRAVSELAGGLTVLLLPVGQYFLQSSLLGILIPCGEVIRYL